MTDLATLFLTESEVPPALRPPAELLTQEARVLIGGEVRPASAEREVRSPVHLRPQPGAEPVAPLLGRAPAVSADESLRALAAARAAWDRGNGRWPTLRPEDRIEAVERFLCAMVARRDVVCRLLLWEIAKSWPDAQGEFDRTVQYLRETIEALKEQDRQASRLQVREGIIAQVRRAPLGVTLCMGPFNYPLNETMATLIPALIMGNPVVVKLPRYGTLLWDPLLQPFADCFPPGVVNIINGDGQEIIPPLMRSGAVDVLAFIGSSRAAHAIKTAHPHLNRLRGVLGLDAKNPALILPDADLQLAVAECAKGALSFNGQRCTGLKLLFVHHSIAERFVADLATAINALQNGMPFVPGTKLTPLCEQGKAARLGAYVDDAVALGAKVVNEGGGRSYRTLYHPALLYPVAPAARLFREEQFGPVVPVVPVSGPEEFLAHVADSTFGQQASLFSQDPKVLGQLIDRLANQVCRINLNSQCQRGPDVFPFTGRKDSAEATLSISDALRAFSIRSMVAAPQTPEGKRLCRAILDGDHSAFLNTDVIL